MPFLILAAVVALALGASSGASSRSASSSSATTVEPGLVEYAPGVYEAFQSAMRSETNPANLRDFANALRPYYPRAASMLDARADAIQARRS